MAMKAILHDGLGDKENAIKWTKQAKEKDPTNDDLENVYQKSPIRLPSEAIF